MKKLAIVYGGNSVESEISVLTALKVYNELVKYKEKPLLVYLDHNGNFYSGDGLLDLENYTLKLHFKKGNFFKKKNLIYFQIKAKKYYFDEVLILGHGINSEDGTISSYFETLKIPYLYDDLCNVSLIQDKVKTKEILKNYYIAQNNYVYLYKYQFEKLNNYDFQLKYPLIVKPCHLGSSIGISKAINEKELIEALSFAFLYDEEVLIEEYIENKIEYNVAICGYQKNIFMSEFEQVNSSSNILSFFDKYDYSSNNEKRIINPQIDNISKKKMLEIVDRVYKNLNLCGIYRFDFIFDTDNSKVYLNEINALPGSLSYYLFEAKGLKFIDLILMDILHLEKKNEIRNKRLVTFQEGFISNVDLSKLKK